MQTYLQQKELSPDGFEPMNHYFDAVVIPGVQLQQGFLLLNKTILQQEEPFQPYGF